MMVDETCRKYESTRAMLLAYGRGESEPVRKALAATSKIKIGDRVLLSNEDHEDHGRYATVLKEFFMKKSGKRKWRVRLEGDEGDETACFMVPDDQLQPAPKKAHFAC